MVRQYFALFINLQQSYSKHSIGFSSSAKGGKRCTLATSVTSRQPSSTISKAMVLVHVAPMKTLLSLCSTSLVQVLQRPAKLIGTLPGNSRAKQPKPSRRSTRCIKEVTTILSPQRSNTASLLLRGDHNSFTYQYAMLSDIGGTLPISWPNWDLVSAAGEFLCVS